MATATKPPTPKVDRAVESGAVALAEQVLPPSEKRLGLARALQDAWRAYRSTRDRVDAAIQRQGAIAEELLKAPDEPTRVKLGAERAELTSILLHAAGDVEAVALPYAVALGAWATSAFRAAKAGYRAVAGEEQPLRQARRRIYHELNPELPANKKTGADLAKLNKRFAALSEQLDALGDRRREFEDVALRAAGAVRKFGEADDSRLFNDAGRRRWVAGVRASVGRQTTGLTGLSDVLKPVSF
jgi:hypothetical protein